MRALAPLPWLLLGGCAAAPPFEGPLRVRNQQPAQLTVLHLDPTTAQALAPAQAQVRVDAAYSSYFSGGAGSGASFEMDGELLRAGVKSGIGLGAGLGLHFEIAVAHTSGGFLDSFLIDFHDFFGLSDGGRDDAPRDRWLVEAQRGGTTVYEMTEEPLELLDLPVELRWAFLPITEEQPFGAALRAAVELPTGDEDRGFGNGQIDWSLGLVGEWRRGPVGLTAHVQHTFAGTPDVARRGGLEFSDVTAFGGGCELWVDDDVAVLLQTEVETSTLRDLGFARVEDPQWVLWGGARFRLSRRIAAEVGFGEDLSVGDAPDFTAYLGMTLRLGGPDG